MSGPIILGQSKNEAPKDDYASLTDQQKADLDALAAKENPEDLYDEVEFAFVIVKHTDGSYGITNDLNPPLRAKRTPDENDYVSSFAVIESNMQAAQTAALVQQGMMQQAAMMQRQMADQQLQSRLKL